MADEVDEVDELAARLPEEQERLGQKIDGLAPLRFWGVMVATVGRKRAAELLGWAVVWGLRGETGSEVLRRLQEEGLSQTSAYRAVWDFRKIGDALLALPEYEGTSVLDSVRRLAAFMAL